MSDKAKRAALVVAFVLLTFNILRDPPNFRLGTVGLGASGAVTSTTCRDAFRRFGTAVSTHPNIDRRPYAVGTLRQCQGRISWLMAANGYQGDAPNDLFPPGERGLDGTTLGRVHDLLCVGHSLLPACAYPYR